MAWLAEIIGLPSGIGGLATTLLMDLPHSRKQEYEGSCPFRLIVLLQNLVPAADKIGLKLSAKACFNPTAAPECVFFRVFYLGSTHADWLRTGCLNALVL